MAKVLVIDDDSGLRQMVKLMLEREGHQALLAENGEAGIEIALKDLPDLAIVDLMMPGLSGYDVTRQLRANPQTARMPIMILTARSQPMDKQMAASAGANTFMSKPVSSKQLSEHLAELLSGVSAATAPPEPPAQQGQESVPAPPKSATSTGTIRRLPIGAETANSNPVRVPSSSAAPADKTLPVTAVLSLRTGSGGTTLAINLTFMLRRLVERVCLLDLSITGGQVGVYLHLPMRNSWANLLPLGEHLDTRAVGGVITAHPQQGVGVIGAPATPTPDSLNPGAVNNLLTLLSSGFQQIVVDMNGLNTASGVALTLARSVIIVLGDDMTSAHSGTNLVQTLQSLNVDLRRVRVVVNHSRPEPGVPVAAIAKAIGVPVTAELPYDVNQMQALRRGVPTVVLAPESAFTQAMYQLSRSL
jgi:CheY-like chemotaxis protein